MKIKKCIILVFFFALQSALLAQWSFSISSENSYDSNPFRFNITEKSMVNAVNLGIERSFENLSIGYYNNYTRFDNISPRNFFWHQLGIFNSSEESIWGVYAEQRINREDYSFLDYADFTGYFQKIFEIGDFYGAYRSSLNITSYKEWDELDNINVSAGFQINRSFETGTTLITGSTINYKNYFNSTIIEGGQELSNYTSQIILFGRVAQSVDSSTGLAFQFTNRNIIAGAANYILQSEFIYGDESQIFDDPAGYEGNSLAVELTRLFAAEFYAKASFYYNQKSYQSLGIFTDEENYSTLSTRMDYQRIFNLSLNKAFALNEDNDMYLTLSLNYQAINNSSNSFWYAYKSNSISLGLDFQF